MAEHTKEPWLIMNRTDIFAVGCPDAEPQIADCDADQAQGGIRDGIPYPQRYANARRIVACVNALSGISDPAATLQAVREALAESADELERLAGILSEEDDALALVVAHKSRAALSLLGETP